MRIKWEVTAADVRRVSAFVQQGEAVRFVRQRIARNTRTVKPRPSQRAFWRAMVTCLLTTQQRSGPGTAVNRLVEMRPFPLDLALCRSKRNVATFVQRVLTRHGGIRTHRMIAEAAATNLAKLEGGFWADTITVLRGLQISDSPATERTAAAFMAEHFDRIGPKQSRNLLQILGLTRYEIPIDSRITKWLNEFGFPIKLSATSLSDPSYYNFVSDKRIQGT